MDPETESRRENFARYDASRPFRRATSFVHHPMVTFSPAALQQTIFQAIQDKLLSISDQREEDNLLWNEKATNYKMKIVTYNVNGLRPRIAQFGSLLKLLDSFDADIICIQVCFAFIFDEVLSVRFSFRDFCLQFRKRN